MIDVYRRLLSVIYGTLRVKPRSMLLRAKRLAIESSIWRLCSRLKFDVAGSSRVAAESRHQSAPSFAVRLKQGKVKDSGLRRRWRNWPANALDTERSRGLTISGPAHLRHLRISLKITSLFTSQNRVASCGKGFSRDLGLWVAAKAPPTTGLGFGARAVFPRRHRETAVALPPTNVDRHRRCRRSASCWRLPGGRRPDW